jgi:hypothetical protein
MDRKYKATLRGRPPPVSPPSPGLFTRPPARGGRRRSGPQQRPARLSVAWTRHAGEGRVKSQGFPGAPASGQPVWESWWGFHKDLPLPTTLAAKAPHHFGQLLVEFLGLTREVRGAVAAHLRDVCDECKGFFCALYRVVASVTR